MMDKAKKKNLLVIDSKSQTIMNKISLINNSFCSFEDDLQILL